MLSRLRPIPFLEKILVDLQKLPHASHNAHQGFTISPYTKWDVRNLEETIVTEQWTDVRFAVTEDITGYIDKSVEIAWKMQKGRRTIQTIAGVATTNSQESNQLYVIPRAKYADCPRGTSAKYTTLYDLPCWSKELSHELRKIPIPTSIPFPQNSDIYQYTFNALFANGSDEVIPLLCLDACVDNDGNFLPSTIVRRRCVAWGSLFGIMYSDALVESHVNAGTWQSAMADTPTISTSYITQSIEQFKKMPSHILRQLCIKLAYARKGMHIIFEKHENATLLDKAAITSDSASTNGRCVSDIYTNTYCGCCITNKNPTIAKNIYSHTNSQRNCRNYSQSKIRRMGR
jgi:hypothetical protein